MIIDGKAIAADILERTKARAAGLDTPPLVVALSDDTTPVTASYLKIKASRALLAGCRFEVRATGADTTDADAVVVQLPVRDEVECRALCDSIPLDIDADVLSTLAREAFERGDKHAILPPVVGAVREALLRAGVVPAGKRAVVVGQGFLVGAPVATWLRREGAEVVVVTEEAGSLRDALLQAEIVVLGAGSPGLVTPDMLPEGVVLIDAGTSESNGKIVGDADPACAAKCSIFTPVPGGIGPIAVACLFENVVALCLERKGRGE